MLKPITTFFHESSFEQSKKLREPNCTKNYIYRDELNKKVPPAKGQAEKGDCGSNNSDVVEEKVAAVMRVKVKMTRQEAARLLAKCKDGGVLEFKDVARELVEIPASRVSIVDRNLITAGAGAGRSSALESIPEY